MTDSARFWSKVNKLGPVHPVHGRCWVWTASTASNMRYGRLKVGGRCVYAHVYSYRISVSDDLHGLCVLHKCDNPQCVKPAHLFLGTRQENNRDMVRKGRRASFLGELNGRQVLTEGQVKSIRKRYRPWCKKNGATAIAREMGVTKTAVSFAARGRNWKHV